MEKVNESWLILKGFEHKGAGTWYYDGTYVHMNSTPIAATRHGITYHPENVDQLKVIMNKKSTGGGCGSC